MVSFQQLSDDLTDASFRTAVLVGLVSIPFTVILSWGSVSEDTVLTGGTISGGPLIVAGLVVGYWYGARPANSRRAGVLTGLVGSIGVVLVYVSSTFTTVWSESLGLAVLAIVLTPVAAVIGVGLSVLTGMVSAILGDWLAEKVVQERNVLGSHGIGGRDARDASWWRCVAVYVLVAPVALIGVGMRPTSDIVVAVGFLLLLFVTFFAIVTLGALFIDATALRKVRTDWQPNVWLYVGAPIGMYALVYLVAAIRRPVNPSGDGMYGFLVGLWITSVVYLALRHRNVGTP